MHAGVGAGHGGGELLRVEDVAFDEGEVAVALQAGVPERVAVEVVVDGDAMAIDEPLDEVGGDEAGASGDEDVARRGQMGLP
jgi:hypothetical protein